MLQEILYPRLIHYYWQQHILPIILQARYQQVALQEMMQMVHGMKIKFIKVAYLPVRITLSEIFKFILIK